MTWTGWSKRLRTRMATPRSTRWTPRGDVIQAMVPHDASGGTTTYNTTQYVYDQAGNRNPGADPPRARERDLPVQRVCLRPDLPVHLRDPVRRGQPGDRAAVRVRPGRRHVQRPGRHPPTPIPGRAAQEGHRAAVGHRRPERHLVHLLRQQTGSGLPPTRGTSAPATTTPTAASRPPAPSPRPTGPCPAP